MSKSAGCYTTRVHSFEIAVGITTLSIWLYLFFARGHFWRLNFASELPRPYTANVTAIIPARNEADVIADSVVSLLRIPSILVIVVDDNSTDDTSRVALEAAKIENAESRLTVLPGTALPPGWSGKLWALRQGIAIARRHRPDFFLLTDADIVHTQTDLERLISLAQNVPYDLASYMVRLRCETVAEKMLIPAFVYFFFKLYPPSLIRNPRSATAGAAGGCVLIRPDALEGAGGLEAIRGEIIDDCALARIVKHSSRSVWLGPAEQTHSIRSYESFSEIGRMISRTAFNQLHHSSLLLAGTILGMLLTYIAPVALLFTLPRAAVIAGFAAIVLMITSYLPITRYYLRNRLWAATLPLAAIFYMGATLVSAFKFWLRRGGEWKGRAQDLSTDRP